MRRRLPTAHRWTAPASALSLAVVLLVAACGTDSPEEPHGPDAATDAGDFDVVAYQGEDALGGEEVNFGSLLGHGTPVVLNFWAAQCPPCRQEMPWFEAVSQQFEGQVLLVGLDVGPFLRLGSNEQGAALLEELEITYPAGYAVDDSPVRQFQVVTMPTTVFFDGDGEVVNTHGGLMTQAQMEDRFGELAAGAR